MLRRSQESSGGAQETVIALGVRVEGNFVSAGDVIIEGDVQGSLETQGSLRVGQQSQIDANVTAKSAVIAGHIKGNITISERLDLLETAAVTGDISAPILSVAPGARVIGTITMPLPTTGETA